MTDASSFAPVRDTQAMIAGMAPVLDPETYHFAGGCDPALLSEAMAAFHEDEGLSLIVTDAMAKAHDLPRDLPMARITLTVHSALDGVGLTAAVAQALAQAGIPCNMVAAYHHDHAFVPADQAEAAMAVLSGLANSQN